MVKVLKSSKMGPTPYKNMSSTVATNVKHKVPDTIYTNDFLVQSEKHCEDGSGIYK